MKSGIYLIRNTKNGLLYVGQSVNIKRRLSVHKNLLLKNKHANDYLQKQFNKYGVQSFSFEVLELCGINKLDEREKYWIKHYGSLERHNGYNLEGGGNANKIISEESRRKKVGENNPQYGKKLTVERIELMRIKNRANSDKLTEKDVEEIKIKYLKGIKQKELSCRFGVKFSTINKIIKCVNWYWVRCDLESSLIGYCEKKKATDAKNIVALYKNGYSQNDIAKVLKIGPTAVKKALVDNNVFAPPDYEIRNEKIVIDFNSGMTKNEIMAKYGISSSVYVSVTHIAFNEKRQEKILKARGLKNRGMLNKDIAKELGLHTCTVKEYLAQTHANTEVSGKTTRHRNA